MEALFHGRAEDVDAMVALCGRGPPHAVVAKVDIVADDGAAPDGFEVRATV